MAALDSAVRAYMEQLAIEQPDLAEDIVNFTDLWDRKLWHQLTDALEEFLLASKMVAPGSLMAFYDNFIKAFATRLNKLRLAQIVRRVSENYEDVEACKTFVDGVIEMVKDTPEAVLFLQARLSSIAQAQENFKLSKSIIDDVREKLDRIPDADPVVHSALARVAMDYHRSKGTPTQYYRNALMFLQYTPIEKLTAEERDSVAYELSLSACIGADIYNFGELLVHPTILTLAGGQHDWLYQMLIAFNQGSIEKFQQICETSAEILNVLPAMVAHKTTLIEKITICALLELVFTRAADERSFAFEEVATATRRPLPEVEHVLMKAMSLGLIKGVIDEVDQVVEVDWIKPRMLQSDQLVVLKDRLGTWAESVSSTISFVEANASELVIAS